MEMTIGEKIKNIIELQQRVNFVEILRVTDEREFILSYKSNIFSFKDEDNNFNKLALDCIDKAIIELKQIKKEFKDL